MVGHLKEEYRVKKLPPDDREYWEGEVLLDHDNSCVVIVETPQGIPVLEDGLIRKNAKVYVVGKLVTQRWTVGGNSERDRTVVKAHRIEVIEERAVRTRYVKDEK